MRYFVGSYLRRQPATDDSGWKSQLRWLLSDQMGVRDIHRQIYLTDLLGEHAHEVIDDMENKLIHYGNIAPRDVSARRLIDFYRTLPDRLEDDAKIYGIAGSGDDKQTIGGNI